MSATERVTARVKWFNNKSGYGFASTLEDTPRDVFVHHTSLKVGKEQYRYLIQGEYVDLDVSPLENDSAGHKWQSSNVTGVKGGLLMCETRQEARDSDRARAKGRGKGGDAVTDGGDQ
jgi:cold shock CspA family protein